MSMEAINSINRKIMETEDQIREIIETYDSNSIIAQFALSETKRRLDSLNSERTRLFEAQAKETVTMRIYGDGIETGKISNRVLISMLEGFQSMIEGIASVLDGSSATKGKISDRAKMLTDFKVTETFAGSFGIKLEKDFEQMELVSNSSDTSRVVRDFFDILESGENPESLIQNISPFGRRTIIRYRDWLAQMKENAINIEINWVDDTAEFRCMNIKYPKADSIIFTLETLEEIENKDVVLTGVLTGINIRQNTFELKTENEIIKGNSKFETLVSISNMINNEICVKLIKTSSQVNSIISKTSWYLVGLYEEKM